MSNKRKSLRGADVFLGLNEASQESATEEDQAQYIKTEKHNNSKPQSYRKERVNFYLPYELVSTLDRVQAEMRQISRQKVTKSEILAVALERAFTEFNENADRSELYEETIQRRTASAQ